MLIGPTADMSTHLTHSRIRKRELLHTSKLLSSGNKYSGDLGQVEDRGGHRFSSGLQARLKTEEAAQISVQHALSYVQTQTIGLRTVEEIVRRMEELAYEATDPVLNDYDREKLDLEFSGLKKSLAGLAAEEQFGTRVFDPLAAHYEDRFPVLGVSDGGWEKQEQMVDIGAKRGKVHLWWNPTWQTDRLTIYHGSDLLFDSGEYRSSHIQDFYNSSGSISGSYDNFTIEFGSATENITTNAGNQGVSLHDKDVDTSFPAKTTQEELDWYSTFGYNYKKFKTGEDYPKAEGTPYGDTEIRFVVNEDAGGFPYTRQAGSSTVWEYYAEIEKSNLTDQAVLVDSEGGTLLMNAVGFSSLSHLTVKDARLAANALDTLSEELGNVRYQMGVIAGEIAQFEARLDVLSGKTYNQKKAFETITGIDMAEEVTRYAKNKILDSTTARALIHSRLANEKVMNLLF